MRWAELLAVALTALQAHKLRSALTALGVVISVFTIVAVLSVVSGMDRFVMTKIVSLAPDVFVVTQFGIITSRDEFLDALKRKPIREVEIGRLSAICESCADIGRRVELERDVYVGDRRLKSVPIKGTSSNMAELESLDVELGRFFTRAEDDHRVPVAVIGSEVRDELFPRVDPVGRTLWIAARPHRVIGLLAKQGSVLGQSPDLVVYAPYRDVEPWAGVDRRLGEGRLVLFVRALGGVPGVARSQEEVLQIFRWLRSTPIAGKDPVAVVSADRVQDLWRSISFLTRVTVWFISGVSLLVGAIVVANIMLVSVVERTREIGLRLALGARKRDLRRQFLLEAILLAVAGGILGTLLGALAAVAIETWSPFPAVVRPGTVALAVGIAGFSGLAAGFFPARKAAKLAPIEALRHE